MTKEELEKEAKEYTSNLLKDVNCTLGNPRARQINSIDIQEAYLAGAEFGYNKANEWHFVKDGDLPKKELEEKQLLVRVRNYTEDYIFAYYMLDKYYSKKGKRFYSDIDCDYHIDLDDIIAWKEIVLPEIKESE